MLNPNFVFLGAIFNLTGSSSYAFDTLRGKTQPNRVTWLLWAVAPLIAFSAQISAGVGIRALMTFMVGFGPAVIFTSSFFNKKAYWKVSKLDIVCGVMSVLAIVLWLLTKTGDIAILFSLVADALALIPTLLKAIKAPETESYNVFFFGAISAAITLLTISHWTFTVAAFPIYILTHCTILFLLIFRKQGIHLVKA